MSRVKLTERGWAGHFIGGRHCMYHRNTLIEYSDRRIIVSTVGNYHPPHEEHQMRQIGYNRYYETMAFFTKEEGGYIEIDVTQQIDFDGQWSIGADSPEQLPDDVDNLADKMHDRVVLQLSREIKGI